MSVCTQVDSSLEVFQESRRASRRILRQYGSRQQRFLRGDAPNLRVNDVMQAWWTDLFAATKNDGRMNDYDRTRAAAV